jgi:chromosome segregation protein
MEKVQVQIDSYNKIIEEKKKEIDEISKVVEEKGEKEQVGLHKNVEDLKVNLATNKTKIGSCENEITRITSRRNQLEHDLGEIDSKIEQLNTNKYDLEKRNQSLHAEAEHIERNIAAFKKKNKLDDLTDVEDKIDEIDRNSEEKQKDIHELREEQQNLLRENDRIEIQVQSVDEKIRKVNEIEKENKVQVNNLKSRRSDFKKATLELNTLLNEDSSLAAKLGAAREKLIRDNEELAKVRAKNIGIQENIFGSVAVKKIIEQKDNIPGIYGTIAELGNVNSRYSLALEIAAGAKLKSIVVESDSVAAKCIKYIKDNKYGTAAFIPLNKIRYAEKNPVIEKFKSIGGVHDLSINLISFDHKFKKAFSYVLGNTLVVDNLNVARRVGIGNARMVTLDGDLSELSGVMHGGYREKKGRHLGFSEKEVTTRLNDLEKGVSENSNIISVLDNRRKEVDEKITSLRQEKATLEGEIIKLEKSLHLGDGDLDASKKQMSEFKVRSDELDNKLRELQNTISTANNELARMKIDKQELKSKINQLRNPTVVAELNTFMEKRDQIKEEVSKIQSDIKGIDIQITDIFGRDKENIVKILKQNEKEQKEFSEEISSLRERIKKQEILLKKLELEEKKFYSQFKGLFAKRNKVNEIVQLNEKKLLIKNDSIRKIELRLNTLSLENARVKAELEGMKEEFKQYEGVKLFNKSEEELKKEISAFERMMNNIGNVNMRALEVYDSVEKEYTLLIEKKDTLVVEKESVINMMNEIEEKKKKIFMNSFDAVNEQFQRIFDSLTTKGNAYLELENPDKLFEGGLRIKVRLSSNKYMDIQSLSGGEKTLTALSFIFAVQEHEPASFYVLDEVDAALDKKNSEKLALLLKKYSGKSQYVIISHNDSLITEADNLYGVSMNEHGMSKVVSLKI